jgi:phospholipid/cholesterol/gamma-HCH transport system substrate-binding protein
MTVKAGNFNLFKKGYTIKAVFTDIDGIDTNSPVMFNGFEVGIVQDVEIIYEKEIKLLLTLFINEGVHIKEGTEAHIKNLGFMGEKYIALNSGNAQGALMKPNSVIIGVQPTDFSTLISKGEQFVNKLDQIAGNVNERLAVNKDNIDNILSDTSTALSNLSDISSTINDSLNKNEASIDSILENFEKMSSNLNMASDNLEDMSLDLKLNPWKLLRKPKERTK